MSTTDDHVRALYRQQRGEALDARDLAALRAFDSSKTQHKGVDGSKLQLTPAEAQAATVWKKAVQQMPVLGWILNEVKGLFRRVSTLEALGLDARLNAAAERLDALEEGDHGVFVEGKMYPKGAAVTLHGNEYRAQRTTRATPLEGSGDWRLTSRRGKQGKDGRPGRDASPEAIDDRLRYHKLIK
jgi:hypothetical protein